MITGPFRLETNRAETVRTGVLRLGCVEVDRERAVERRRVDIVERELDDVGWPATPLSRVRASLGPTAQHTRVTRCKGTWAIRTSFAADREAEFLFEKGEFGSVPGDLIRECGALLCFDCGARRRRVSKKSTGASSPRGSERTAHVLSWLAISPGSLSLPRWRSRPGLRATSPWSGPRSRAISPCPSRPFPSAQS